MAIQSIPLTDLACDPANARKHDPRNLEAIRASLQKFGQQKPIVIDANGAVVAGNGTLEAARALGWDGIDAVRTDLVGADAVAYAIADNRTAELAGWDDDVLTQALAGLQKDADFDHLATGFTDSDIESMIGNFQPVSIGEQGRLDEKAKTTCPECGHEF